MNNSAMYNWEPMDLTCCGGAYTQATHPACLRCHLLFGPDHDLEAKRKMCDWCAELTRRERRLTPAERELLKRFRSYGDCKHDVGPCRCGVAPEKVALARRAWQAVEKMLA